MSLLYLFLTILLIVKIHILDIFYIPKEKIGSEFMLESILLLFSNLELLQLNKQIGKS